MALRSLLIALLCLVAGCATSRKKQYEQALNELQAEVDVLMAIEAELAAIPYAVGVPNDSRRALISSRQVQMQKIATAKRRLINLAKK